MSVNDINNPLYDVTVGSTVNNLQDGFSASVVVQPVTKMIAQTQSRAVMTGKSSFVYSNTMNRGSLGISGSYGLSAISQISASAFGYVGQAKADDGRETRVDYHVILQAGVEYINFNELKPADLMASLAGSCKDPASEALDKYNALLKPNLTESKRLSALQDWMKARAKFFEAAGNGVVVGVLWGAIGSVSLTMKQKSGSTAWQYGAKGNFSYAGIGASVSVEATYDGSSESGKGDVSVDVSKYYSGSAIADEVNTWYSDFAGKGFDQLANVQVIASPNFPQEKLDPPSIPSFIQPTPDPKITARLENLKNLQELNQLEKDAKFEEEKIKNPQLTRDEFDKMVAENADIENLNELSSKVRNNSIGLPEELFDFAFSTHNSLAGVSNNSEDSVDEPLIEAIGSNFLELAETTTNPNDGQYTPLGVWIVNWSDLFPWLSTAALNSIDSTQKAEELLLFRTVIQDFDSLRKIYYYAHDGGLKVGDLDFSSISDSFSQQMARLATSTTFSMTELKNAIAGLSDNAKAIYKKWVEVEFLRDCELGLGIIYDNDWTLSFEGRPLKDDSWGAGSDLFVNYFQKIDFNPSTRNYSAFAESMKCMPILFPSGKISVFGAYIAKQNRIGIMTMNSVGMFTYKDSDKHIQEDNLAVQFSSEGAGDLWTLVGEGSSYVDIYAEFTPNKQEKTLESEGSPNPAESKKIKAYPIPFRAAQGVQEWKGQSLSTNIGSFTDLQDQLDHFSELLKNQKTWSFSSENFPVDWKGSDYYALRKIRTQYVGIEPESGNVFPKTN